MANEEEEYRPETYYIPNNFKDAGGVLGGKLGKRNAVELFVICGPIALIEFKLLFPFISSMETKIIIGMVTLLPLALLCAFGIGGESLSQMVLSYIRFKKGRRTLHYRSFTKPEDVGSISANSKFEKFMSDANSAGFMQAMKNFSASSSEDKKKEQGMAVSNDDANDIDDEENDDTAGYSERRHTERTSSKSKVPEQSRASKSDSNYASRKKTGSTKRAPVDDRSRRSRGSGLISSATKEMLLRKLELGDDDDFD